MAAPRKPTAVLELAGAYRKNPQRERERAEEPEPKAGIGPAPSHLSIPEAECWDYLVGIAPVGVLGDSDRAHLEITARLLAWSWTCSIEKMEAAKLTKLVQCLGALGFNPSDRSKVKVGGKPNRARPNNAFADL